MARNTLGALLSTALLTGGVAQGAGSSLGTLSDAIERDGWIINEALCPNSSTGDYLSQPKKTFQDTRTITVGKLAYTFSTKVQGDAMDLQVTSQQGDTIGYSSGDCFGKGIADVPLEMMPLLAAYSDSLSISRVQRFAQKEAEKPDSSILTTRQDGSRTLRYTIFQGEGECGIVRHEFEGRAAAGENFTSLFHNQSYSRAGSGQGGDPFNCLKTWDGDIPSVNRHLAQKSGDIRY